MNVSGFQWFGCNGQCCRTYSTIDLDQFEHGMKIKTMVLLLLLLILYFAKRPTHTLYWVVLKHYAKPTLMHNCQKNVYLLITILIA